LKEVRVALMIGYFDELAAAVSRDDGKTTRAAIARTYSMEVVGPPSER
jgi:hypothetical protein